MPDEPWPEHPVVQATAPAEDFAVPAEDFASSPVDPPPLQPPSLDPPAVQPPPDPVPPQAAVPPQAPPPPPEDLPPEPAPEPAAPAPVRGVETVSSMTALGGHRIRRGGRRGVPRMAALFALGAVVVAVTLLARTLLRSKSTRTATLPPVVKVLIPEGETRLQIAQIAKHDGLTGSYRQAARRSNLLNPVRYGAPASTPDLEGFLFPATYELDRGAPASRLVSEQLIAFKENFGTAEISSARALHITPYQLLTVASMVEREARVPADRAKIAAVIYNRLKRGMPLGVDATIYYAIELRTGTATYTKELTEAQLHIDSPYNTRTRVGLPPTPISNPGLASIRAAAHPAHVSYLYYVLAADGCGEHVFSKALAEFEANDAAYQAALRKNGGHPPACKHK